MTRRRRAGIAMLLAGLVALTGCSAIRSVQSTVGRLKAAGYEGVDLELQSTGALEQVRLSYAGVGRGDAQEQQRALRASEIVWRHLEVYFDELVVVVIDSSYDDGRLGYSRSELSAMFGPRPAALDEVHVGDEFLRVSKRVGYVVVGSFLLLLCTFPTIFFLMRRVRRRRPVSDVVPAPFDPADPWAPPPS